MAKKKTWFKWVVELQVHESWVADGFNLDNDRAHDMLGHELPYSFGHERKARVISKPLAKDIRKVQGY